jgi:rhodanese-related sulfurtransferase
MTTQTTSRIDHLLAGARARLCRLHARQVPDALRRGAVLVDIRPQAQREREGSVPAALVIERNVLEWRCDPTSDARLRQAVDGDVEWVVLCSEGYTSSLAAVPPMSSAAIGRWSKPERWPSRRERYSLGFTSPRSRSVFSGVHPGGCRISDHAFTTSLT